MPVEVPYFRPGSVSDTVDLPDAGTQSPRLTVGKIALAVFLGNVATGMVCGAIWAVFFH